MKNNLIELQNLCFNNINILSLMQYICAWEYYDGEVEEFDQEFINELCNKFFTYMIPARNKNHSGDCTNDPWACDRCEIEGYDKISNQIMKGVKEYLKEEINK